MKYTIRSFFPSLEWRIAILYGMLLVYEKFSECLVHKLLKFRFELSMQSANSNFKMIIKLTKIKLYPTQGINF